MPISGKVRFEVSVSGRMKVTCCFGTESDLMDKVARRELITVNICERVVPFSLIIRILGKRSISEKLLTKSSSLLMVMEDVSALLRKVIKKTENAKR